MGGFHLLLLARLYPPTDGLVMFINTEFLELLHIALSAVSGVVIIRKLGLTAHRSVRNRGGQDKKAVLRIRLCTAQMNRRSLGHPNKLNTRPSGRCGSLIDD